MTVSRRRATMTARTRLIAVAIETVVALTGRFSFGEEEAAARQRAPIPVEAIRQLVTPETDRAIDRALVFLASRQDPDGALGSGGYRKNVAVTALTGLAFVSAGHLPGRGESGDVARRAVEFLMKSAQPSGYMVRPESPTHGPMYGHGFATLFLAEILGEADVPGLRQQVKLATNVIVNSQNKEGGWRYDPDGRDADVSVTVCQIMALRAARNSGIAVPKETIDRCVQYVRRCQNVDGGFRYQLSGRPQSAFPRTAAGVVTFYGAGIYEGRELEQGLGFLRQSLRRRDLLSYEGHYFYGQYYVAQAMWQAGGDDFSEWYAGARDDLLRRRLVDGSWPDPMVCSEYATAMAVLILQTPNGYLPIFER